MRAIVSIHRFDSGDQFSMTTSYGATVNQAIRSQNPNIQAIMDAWVDERFASRSVIWEINYDLARTLVLLAGREGLPADLLYEIKHKFPELDNERNAIEGARQSKAASQAGAPVQGDSERTDQAQERRLSTNELDYGQLETLVANWNDAKQVYVLILPKRANRDALRSLLKSNGANLNEVSPHHWEYTV